MSLAYAAGLTALTATSAYLNARLHISKDLADLRERRNIIALVGKLVKQDRLSPWYAFEEQARRLKGEECIWYREQPSDAAATYTWTETYQNCCRMAQYLLSKGVKPGELVGTYLINSPDCAFSLPAMWAIGCAPAMINYNLSGPALAHSLKVSGSKLLLVENDEGCLKRIEESRTLLEELGIEIVILDQSTKAKIYAGNPERPSDEYRRNLTLESPIFLFYTSGTTGFPKACALPMRAGPVLTDSRLRTCNMKAGPKADTWYDCMPLYHGTGGTTLVGSLMCGTRIAIGRRFSVRNFWRDIHDSNANCFIYVGETARYLLAAPPSPLDRGHKLKAMYGNGMRPDVWRKFVDRFDIPIVNEFFNSTEGMLSMLNVCKNKFHDAHVGHHGAIRRWLFSDSIVPVEPNHEDGDELRRDPKTGFAIRKSYEEGGEIMVQCPTGKEFIGYWNNSQATEKKLARDVFRKGDIWYRTGDSLRRDADGRWFFLDRLGDTFRWKSENVSSQEVAEVLGRFPGLKESNIYGVELPHHDGRAGCAAIYIAPEERASFDYAALLTHARKGLPKYAVPVFLRLLKTQSPMHNNKQNKVPLRNEGVNPQKVREGVAGSEDELFWVQPMGDTYVPFSDGDWDAIAAEKARL